MLMVRRQRLFIWFLVAGMLAGSLFVGLASVGYQQQTLDPWTWHARLKTWGLGLQQSLENPVVGIGFGNDIFTKAYATEIEADKDKGPVEKVLPALHNTFAMVLMGSGVPALVLFVSILVGSVYQLGLGAKLRDQSQKVSDGLQNGYMVLRTAIALAVIGFAVRNLFDYMFAGSLASLFWILLAVGLSINHRDVPVDEPENDAIAVCK